MNPSDVYKSPTDLQTSCRMIGSKCSDGVTLQIPEEYALMIYEPHTGL